MDAGAYTSPVRVFSKSRKTEWRYVAVRVFERDRYACRACHVRFGLTVHHLVPRDQGGTDSMKNLITLCGRCHNLVEPMTQEEAWTWITDRHRAWEKRSKRTRRRLKPPRIKTGEHARYEPDGWYAYGRNAWGVYARPVE